MVGNGGDDDTDLQDNSDYFADYEVEEGLLNANVSGAIATADLANTTRAARLPFNKVLIQGFQDEEFRAVLMQQAAGNATTNRTANRTANPAAMQPLQPPGVVAVAGAGCRQPQPAAGLAAQAGAAMALTTTTLQTSPSTFCQTSCKMMPRQPSRPMRRSTQCTQWARSWRVLLPVLRASHLACCGLWLRRCCCLPWERWA
jgi:hypothetical protein